MDIIFSPEDDLTNSLLMKRPVGSVIFLPFGAVRLTERPDILRAVEVKKRSRVNGNLTDAEKNVELAMEEAKCDEKSLDIEYSQIKAVKEPFTFIVLFSESQWSS